MSFAYDPKYLHKLSGSLRTSRRLAKLSAALLVLGCHLGTESAVCNGCAPRKAALSSGCKSEPGRPETHAPQQNAVYSIVCSPRASSVGGTVKSGQSRLSG